MLPKHWCCMKIPLLALTFQLNSYCSLSAALCLLFYSMLAACNIDMLTCLMRGLMRLIVADWGLLRCACSAAAAGQPARGLPVAGRLARGRRVDRHRQPAHWVCSAALPYRAALRHGDCTALLQRWVGWCMHYCRGGWGGVCATVEVGRLVYALL